MTLLAQPPRARCWRCSRPLTACICRWITPLHSAVELLILQHPLEVDNAKGSARLLHLSVAGSTLIQGEVFDPAELSKLLSAGGRHSVLLYPATPGDRLCAVPPTFEGASHGGLDALRLVVLDGTWRKSRKMLYQNPVLQSLPRLPLVQMPASHYLIRKAHAPDQLSTLEASCYALGQLHGDTALFLPLLHAFDEFVAHFQRTGGKLDALPNRP